MYIATGYFDTRFKKSFKRGEVVPNEIAELYSKYVTKDGDKELLVETPSEVTVTKVDEDEVLDEADKQKKKQTLKSLKKS